MEKFYFCNFLDEVMERKADKGVTKVEVSKDLTEEVSLAKAYLVGKGENLTLRFVCADDKCDGVEFDFIGSFNNEDKKVKSSVEELSHTEENPIILVATKKIKVFRGIPSYMKYIPVRGGVVVALIKGFIAVEDYEGNMIPLSRNCNGLSDETGVVFDAKELYKLNSLTDRESDVAYSDYVVSDCIIHLEATKDGRDMASYKFSKEHFVYLYKKVFEDGKALKEEKKRKAKEDAELRKQRELEAMRERREMERLAEEERIQAKSKKRTSKKEEKVETGYEGAASFLAFVESVKKNGK